jgi:hypothetical protein
MTKLFCLLFMDFIPETVHKPASHNILQAFKMHYN